jgi:hypothetical protein
MSKPAPERSIVALLEEHPDIFEPEDHPCDDAEIDEIEIEIGHHLPSEVETFLRMSDGGVLHAGHETLHLASLEQLLVWHSDGVMEDLEVFPFAHNGSDILLLLDNEGAWGGSGRRGGVYRLNIGRRTVGGYPVQDATRIADNMIDFLQHLVAGDDAL